MRNYTLFTLTAALGLALSSFSGCDKDANENLGCNTFNLNESFTAKSGETWCLKGDDLEITFGDVVEDSRCNVTGIDCVWAGRYVSAVSILDNNETLRDTFFAVNNWQDTLYVNNHAVLLNKVNPEIRQDMQTLPDEAYSLEILVK